MYFYFKIVMLFKKKYCNSKKVLQSLEVHAKSSDHFRAFWYPHTDNVMVYHASRTNNVNNCLIEY